MDILKSHLFPYLQGLHLFNKKPPTMTISHIKAEMLPDHKGNDQEKFVLYFQGSDKGLVLNKTNVKMLVTLLGRETDDWTGKKIRLTHSWVKAFGKTVHAIRVVDEQLNNGNDQPLAPDSPMPETVVVQAPLAEDDQWELERDGAYGS